MSGCATDWTGLVTPYISDITDAIGNIPGCLAVKGDFPKEIVSVHSCWPVSWMYCSVCNHFPLLCQQYVSASGCSKCEQKCKQMVGEQTVLKFTDLFTWDLGSLIAVRPALVSEVNLRSFWKSFILN